jgi:hypothetical protein
VHSPTTPHVATPRRPTTPRNQRSTQHSSTVATEVGDAKQASLTLHEPGPREPHNTHGAKP